MLHETYVFFLPLGNLCWLLPAVVFNFTMGICKDKIIDERIPLPAIDQFGVKIYIPAAIVLICCPAPRAWRVIRATKGVIFCKEFILKGNVLVLDGPPLKINLIFLVTANQMRIARIYACRAPCPPKKLYRKRDKVLYFESISNFVGQNITINMIMVPLDCD